MDSLHLRLGNLTINLLATSITIQPALDFRPIQTRALASSNQHVIRRHIAIFFMMQLKQGRSRLILNLVGLGFRQLNQPMRIAGVADPAVQRKLDAFAFTDGLEARMDHGEAVGAAQLLAEIGLGVDTARFGQRRVEVEGVPGHGEGVICAAWDDVLVELDGALETGFADVALEICFSVSDARLMDDVAKVVAIPKGR